MDVALQARADSQQKKRGGAGQTSTAADLNALMRLMTKAALERMINTHFAILFEGRMPENPAP